MSKYDSRTNVFAPDGRVLQVEYAQQSIANAALTVGILAEDGVVLAAERRGSSKLLEQNMADKLFKLNDNMICAVAGFTADAHILVDYSRHAAQQHLMNYNCDIPCQLLVHRVCSLKQSYTQFGGRRPFGASILYAGYDSKKSFQLYQSHPSGNYGGWLAATAGTKSNAALECLKERYQPCTLNAACALAVKVLSETLDSTKLNSEKIEVATVGRNKDGEIYRHIWTAKEVNALLRKHVLLKEDALV